MRAFQKRQRSGQDGNQRQKDEQKIEFKKEVVEGDEDMIDENLRTTQKTIETAPGNVAHHIKAEREFFRVRRSMSDYVNRPLQDARKRLRG